MKIQFVMVHMVLGAGEQEKTVCTFFSVSGSKSWSKREQSQLQHQSYHRRGSFSGISFNFTFIQGKWDLKLHILYFQPRKMSLVSKLIQWFLKLKHRLPLLIMLETIAISQSSVENLQQFYANNCHIILVHLSRSKNF